MDMAVQQGEWTAELARALPDDGNRYEVLDGELFVTPVPARLHQRALLALYNRLKPYVVAHRLGELLLSPADIEFSSKRLLQPDLFVDTLVWRPRDESKPLTIDLEEYFAAALD